MKITIGKVRVTIDGDGDVALHTDGGYQGYITAKQLDKLFLASIAKKHAETVRVMRETAS